ncbi:hypothetical protein BCR33DRAFT_478282 [Rhizoclosmatium globosum]|uniref:Acyltransferase 3 domain-containing protein n=1 Tax=Rhizoclosmatium globosum TaxID=329046 RepID=A0A1Y2BP56_9FUNG|nr:hypothetical protein BCR33DRAFT_478282 [Rhizoclosmatium globosum]|eukprot:ORY36528.1 hypothetical protein BCR33DRAFT_478282 [Rhizoclosmatium globosum]
MFHNHETQQRYSGETARDDASDTHITFDDAIPLLATGTSRSDGGGDMTPKTTSGVSPKLELPQIEYLNGLRGLGALQVFLLHCRLGNFFDPIPIFYLLSGRVLCLSYLQRRDPAVLASAMLRRVFRILLPVLACSFLNWIFWATGLYHYGPIAWDTFPGWESYVGAGWDATLHIPTLVQSLIQPFHLLIGNYKRITYPREVDWTLPHEMDGSWLVFMSVFVMTHFPDRKYLAYSILFVVLFLLQRWTSLFIVGLAMAEASSTTIRRWKDSPRYSAMFWFKYLLAVFVLGALVTDAVTGAQGNGTVFKSRIDKVIVFFVPTPEGELLGVNRKVPGFIEFQNAGSVMGILILFLADTCLPIQSFLEIAPIKFLGKIAFSLYLLHPIFIASLGAFVAVQIPVEMQGSKLGQIIWATPTFVVTAFVSWLFSETVEKWSVLAGKKVETLMGKKASHNLNTSNGQKEE